MPSRAVSVVRAVAYSWCALLAACSSDLGSMREGEACTRSSQCQSGLVCRTGVCSKPGPGNVDAGGDDDAGK
jgi:hypothetical protein